MRKIKNIVSIFLAVAMVISGISVFDGNSVQAATDEEWKSTAITAPEQGKLIGAGYIDIKWNNDLEDVKQYQVYFDGALKKTVNASTSSAEVYTVKVSSHTAYIVAVKNDGTKVTTDTRTFYVTKKGICVNTKDMGMAVDPAAMNIGWYYDWGTQSFEEMNYKTNTKFNGLDFVPMIYSDPNEEFSDIFARTNAQGYKYMLAYNEPDLTYEANVSPSIMLLRWDNKFRKYKGNMRLGSPAISTAKPLVESTDWWIPFWNGLSTASRKDMSFIAVHKYYENYNAASAYEFLMLLDETYYKYRKPIWVTEFAVWNVDKGNAKSVANAQEFLKIVCKGMNERSYVERYSWFCPDYNGTSASASSLYVYQTGALTTIGKMYANIGNPSGYKAKTYSVSSNTSADTSIKGCVAKQPTVLYGTTTKKKAFAYSIKSVARASGFQIQYGTKKNMKGAKTKNVTKREGKIKVTFTKAQKKKIKKKPKKYKTFTYYVRARAYKTINGTKYYYAWSSVEKTKVKTK